MVKIAVTAEMILAMKKYKTPKFNQNGFNARISEFFIDHNLEDTILVVPKRFIEMKVAGDPETMPDEEKAIYEEKKAKLEEDKQRGWIDMTDTSVWEKKVDDPYDPFTFTDYIVANNKGLIRPMIYVDEGWLPGVLNIMSTCTHFKYKKQRGGKYLISLI